MKFFRCLQKNKAAVGFVDKGRHYLFHEGLIPDLNGARLSKLRSLQPLAADGGAKSASPLEIETPKQFLAPVSGTRKIVCVGLNYLKHIEETKDTKPSEPVLFMKASSALCSASDEIILPPGSLHTDWEIELAVVIGRKAYYIQEEAAADYIAGYSIIIDISERKDQIQRMGQWVKGKSHKHFAPLGPYLVTGDEIGDLQNLSLELFVNGKVMQKSNTSAMIFNTNYIVSYISQFMILEPGDIIATGTPDGVAMGRPDKPYLKAGDELIARIESLGEQRHRVVASKFQI